MLQSSSSSVIKYLLSLKKRFFKINIKNKISESSLIKFQKRKLEWIAAHIWFWFDSK